MNLDDFTPTTLAAMVNDLIDLEPTPERARDMARIYAALERNVGDDEAERLIAECEAATAR